MEKLKKRKIFKAITLCITITTLLSVAIISISANTIDIEAAKQAQRTPFGFSEMVTGYNTSGTDTWSTEIIHETQDWFEMEVGETITNNEQINNLRETKMGTKFMLEEASVTKINNYAALITHKHKQETTVDEFYKNGMFELQSQYMLLTTENIKYLEDSSIAIYNDKWDFNEWENSIDPSNNGLATKAYLSYRVLYPTSTSNFGTVKPIIKNEIHIQEELTDTSPIVDGNENVIGREYKFTDIFSYFDGKEWEREFSNNGAVIIYDIKLTVIPTEFGSANNNLDKISFTMYEFAHIDHASDISLLTRMNFPKITTTEEDININFVSWILEILDNTFNFEIIPGVKIGMIIWFIMGLSLLFVMLKLFMGG